MDLADENFCESRFQRHPELVALRRLCGRGVSAEFAGHLHMHASAGANVVTGRTQLSQSDNPVIN